MQHELHYLIPTIEQAPVLGEQTIALECNPERSVQLATLTVRGMQVTLPVPRHPQQPKACQPVTLNVLWVEETISLDRI